MQKEKYFYEIGQVFYFGLIAPILRFVFSMLEKGFPKTFPPLYDITEFSGQREGRMVLLHKQVFEYRFSEQFSEKPEKKLVSEYVRPS